jgi:hypothetical protein
MKQKSIAMLEKYYVGTEYFEDPRLKLRIVGVESDDERVILQYVGFVNGSIERKTFSQHLDAFVRDEMDNIRQDILEKLNIRISGWTDYYDEYLEKLFEEQGKDLVEYLKKEFQNRQFFADGCVLIPLEIFITASDVGVVDKIVEIVVQDDGIGGYDSWSAKYRFESKFFAFVRQKFPFPQMYFNFTYKNRDGEVLNEATKQQRLRMTLKYLVKSLPGETHVIPYVVLGVDPITVTVTHCELYKDDTRLIIYITSSSKLYRPNLLQTTKDYFWREYKDLLKLETKMFRVALDKTDPQYDMTKELWGEKATIREQLVASKIRL